MRWRVAVVHADPGIADGQHRVVTRAWREMIGRRRRRRDSARPISMVSVPPSGIASWALTARFRITCSIWLGSAFTCPSASSKRKASSTCSPISRRQHALHPARRRRVRLMIDRLEDLLPAERQELARERGGALAGVPDLQQVGAQRGVARQVERRQLRGAVDHGQQVVEVVGDAAGEPPDALHLLRLAELLFELALVGDVDRPCRRCARAVRSPSRTGKARVRIHRTVPSGRTIR